MKFHGYGIIFFSYVHRTGPELEKKIPVMIRNRKHDVEIYSTLNDTATLSCCERCNLS